MNFIFLFFNKKMNSTAVGPAGSGPLQQVTPWRPQVLPEIRNFLRVAKVYRVEYGPFPPPLGEMQLKPGTIRNIGGGGLMFHSPEPFETGDQLVLRIHLPGWLWQGDDIVESGDLHAEAMLTAIAEVRHTTPNPEGDSYAVGVKFLGRLLVP